MTLNPDPVDDIIAKRKREGIESITADESAEVMGYLREQMTGKRDERWHEIAALFVCEADEVFNSVSVPVAREP